MIGSFYVNGVHTVPSNFYAVDTVIDGFTYPTNEHYFQAMKTVNLTEREGIRTAATPGAAKRLGRRCTLRGDWEAIRLAVMRRGLQYKFSPGTGEASWLLATGDELLVEGNNWGDRYWGMVNGEGENWLGHLLMARRAELRAYT